MKLRIDISVQTECGEKHYQVVAGDVERLKHMRPSLTLIEIREPKEVKAVMPYPFLCNTHDGKILPMTIQVLRELARVVDLGKVESF